MDSKAQGVPSTTDGMSIMNFLGPFIPKIFFSFSKNVFDMTQFLPDRGAVFGLAGVGSVIEEGELGAHEIRAQFTHVICGGSIEIGFVERYGIVRGLVSGHSPRAQDVLLLVFLLNRR